MTKIEFSDAKMYIAEPDGSYTPIGKANGIECVCDDSEDNAFYAPFTKLADSFECVCKLSEEAAMAIFGVRNAVLKCCPNKRVAYLASNAKKARTRKKNLRRAIKLLEKMEDKNAL